jgi:release factor glutamine methyltransferase
VTGEVALREAAARLAAAGVEDPRRDARRLLAHAIGIAPDSLAAHLGRSLSDAEHTRFEAAVARRARRQPVSQIVGVRAFRGRDFEVTPDVLDPRADTETLVDLALAAPFARVLDLGTGSGAILVTLLAERPEASGLGVDLSPDALEVAGRNAARHGVADRARLVHSDWFAGVEGRFDLIVSNPPYISAAELPGLDPEVRAWEPRLALSGGIDGLDAYRVIAAGAAARLLPGGRLLLETGAGQGAGVSALLGEAGLAGIACHDDLAGRHRVVSAQAR